MGLETFEGIYFEKYSEGLRYCQIIFLCLELCFNFLLKIFKLVAGFTFKSFSLRLARNTTYYVKNKQIIATRVLRFTIIYILLFAH